MALVVSRVGAEKGGPFLTSLHGMWWARAKLSYTAGSTYLTGGLPLGTSFKTAFGFSRLAFIGADHTGGDVGAATALGVVSEAMLFLIRSNQRIAYFGLGRAVNGGAGVLVPIGTELSNGTSIDAMTFLVQIWGFM